jgi:type III secretion protein J
VAGAKLMSRYIICFFLLIMLTACGDEKVELLNELLEDDANEVVAELVSNGIEAKKVIVKKNISVIIAAKDMAKSYKVLKAAGIPNAHRSNMGEIFKKEGMMSTPLEERARYIYALSQELEFTFSQIDQVLVARVHVVLPERVAPGQPIQPSSAAIFIKHLPNLDPDTIEPKIRRMVSTSIPGLSELDKSKISISFVPSIIEKPVMQWEKVGPFMLSKESAIKFRSSALVFGMLVFLIAAGVGFLFFMKKKKKEKEVKENASNSAQLSAG